MTHGNSVLRMAKALTRQEAKRVGFCQADSIHAWRASRKCDRRSVKSG